MKKLFLLIIFVLPACLFAQFLPFKSGEKLDYDIFYHWGIIWKRAGTATLTVEDSEYKDEPAYKMQLNGRTLAFADKIMRVRDTLVAYTNHELQPLYYAKISNEGSFWGKDQNFYSYPDEGITNAYVTVDRKKRPSRDSLLTLEGQAFDMLTVFYYLRILDYSRLAPNTLISIPIFTGRKLITMLVRYKGETNVKLRNKSQFPSYRLNLSFVNDDSFKEDDDPIEVWLSADSQKIPLKVEGKLPIGSLQAEYRDANSLLKEDED